MVYSEFLEAMAACAAILYPDPYIILHNRVEMFFKEKLFPAASEMLMKQGKKL